MLGACLLSCIVNSQLYSTCWQSVSHRWVAYLYNSNIHITHYYDYYFLSLNRFKITLVLYFTLNLDSSFFTITHVHDCMSMEMKLLIMNILFLYTHCGDPL